MRILSGILLVAAMNSSAAADTGTIEGQVVETRGRFVAGGLRIVTDVTIRTDDGRVVTVVERGGHAGTLGQLTLPGPPIPRAGDFVTVRAKDGFVEDVIVRGGGRVPFVRTGPTDAGRYLSWASGCVFLTYDEQGTADIPGDTEFDILDEAIAIWNDALDSCDSYFQLQLAGFDSVDPGDKVGVDRTNRILFRDDRWCRPAHDDVPEDCLPAGAAGLTTVTYINDPDSSRDGEIVDTDIEINGEEFAISSQGTSMGEPACLSDLLNTMVHELGHVIGLDHTCLAPGDDPKVDGDGNPVPLCSATDDPAITSATMYNFQECGETSKSTLEADDIDAACSAYPRENDPGSCEPVQPTDPGCCSTGGGGAPGAAALALVTFAAAARRRRSRA